MALDRRFMDIVFLGIAFMFIFTAFQSCGMIQQAVLEAAYNSSNQAGLSKHSGYYSLAMIYTSFTICSLFVSPIVSALGAKLSMIVGAILYILFMASFLKLKAYFLYTCSILLGFGAAMIWTGQGNYLSLSSDDDTNGRNSGVLWALFQCSFLSGSLFLYFEFRGKDVIDQHTIFVVYLSFTILACLGTLILVMLRKPQPLAADRLAVVTPIAEPIAVSEPGNLPGEGYETVDFAMQEEPVSRLATCMGHLTNTFRLLTNFDMILLAVVFFYTGLELTFFSSVYGTCLVNMKYFKENANSLIGLSGMGIGVGEILGGATFGIFGSRTIRYSRNPIIFLGLVAHLAVFFIAFINLSNDAPIQETFQTSYITPSKILAVLGSFLLGLADSCWQTQICSILCSLFPEDSVPAFALFKFFQVKSMAASIAFGYASKLLLQYQLIILTGSAVIASICFFQVEWGVVALQASLKSDKNS